MKCLRPSSHCRFLLSALWMVGVVLTACQPAGSTPAATSVPGSPATQSPTQGLTQAAPTSPASAATWSLLQPGVGLAAYTGYHQSYSSSMKGTYQGKPYTSLASIERSVRGQDETSLVNSTVTGQKPFYLQSTSLGGQIYVQQKAGLACRAQDQADQAQEDLNPVNKLPSVSGGSNVGSEPLNGLTANHYHFDAGVVRSQAGKNGTADGDVWVANETGAVLKYQLTVEIKDGDFIGTRSWTYELKEVNKGTPVALPAGCLPLLASLPVLPGAANVVSIPGFISYSAGSTIADAVTFFGDQLPSQGWYALPGDAPHTASAQLKFGREMDDGSGQMLAIQLASQGQGIQVVIQIVITHKPIKAGTPQTPGLTPSAPESTREPTEPDETAEPGSSATLPEDLPVYPGAQVLL